MLTAGAAGLESLRKFLQAWRGVLLSGHHTPRMLSVPEGLTQKGHVMPRIINLTPHSVTLAGVTYASAGVARVATTEEVVSTIYLACPVHADDACCGCTGLELPIVRQQLGLVQGLPEREDDTIIIVSRMVCAAMPGRPDLMCPARLTRDEQGRVVGCGALETLHRA